jgi:ABC-type lipoprotein release transport system permease subunit
MFDLLRMAARNVTRNRRRSVLNVTALMVGMTIMIASLGWVRGYFTTLYTGMMEFDTGQIQILHRDYLAQERRVPLDLLVEDYHAMRTALVERAPVREAAGRIRYEVEVGNGREYLPMLGRAVDPERERAITTVQEYLVSGEYLRRGEPGVLIGAEAAERLGLATGDTVYLRVRDHFGAPNTVVHPVTGIFRIGYPLFDRNLVLTDLEETGSFLRTDRGEGVTHLVIALEPGFDPEHTARALQEELPRELSAYPWQRFARTMIAAVEADRGAFVLLMGILFLLIMLGILNSMSMAVQERSREIGTMRAIGLKKHQLVVLLVAESMILAIIAAAIAAVFGGAAAAYVQFIGFDVAGSMPEDLPIPFGERFHGDYRPVDFLISTGFGIITALAGTIIPVRRALRMRPADTMRLEGVTDFGR